MYEIEQTKRAAVLERRGQVEDAEIEKIINKYGDMLYRTAMMMLTNPQDAQDVLQEVMLRVMQKAPVFCDSEHEKAWLLRVTINLSKDMLRFRKRHQYMQIDGLAIEAKKEEDKGILEEISRLLPKWRIMLLLYYVEGYSIKEIAGILAISENAAKKRMQRAKEALKKRLGDAS